MGINPNLILQKQYSVKIVIHTQLCGKDAKYAVLERCGY